MGQFDVGCRVPFMEELPTVGRLAEIDHSDRDIFDTLVVIHGLVDERIGQGSDEKDQHDTGVSKDPFEFTRKDKCIVRSHYCCSNCRSFINTFFSLGDASKATRTKPKSAKAKGMLFIAGAPISASLT